MRNRRGFFLYELLIALAVLLVVMDIADHVLYGAFWAMQSDELLANRSASVDAAMQSLRRDVWTAQSLRCVDAHHLIVTQKAGDIDWSIDADGKMCRNNAARWPCTAAGWRFAMGASDVILTDPDSAAPMEFCSQILLSGARR
jgi:hypothetical protein